MPGTSCQSDSMTKPHAFVTAGPAREPLDEVRWLTNRSSGGLGVHLAATLADAGCDVTLFLGMGATVPVPDSAVRTLRFETNASLAQALERESDTHPDAVFHAAALCDFTPASGASTGKIRSDLPKLSLDLIPAPKVIASLRQIFPDALLVGWKYEVDAGEGRTSIIARGLDQMKRNATDACVLNGPAWGNGFGLITNPEAQTEILENATLLCARLARSLKDVWRARLDSNQRPAA